MNNNAPSSFPIRPLKDYVVVKLSEIKDTTSGGIILAAGRETRDQKCLIVAKGSTVTEVDVSQYVQIQLGDFKLIKHDNLPDGDFAMVKEEHIVGIFEN